jgi:hypothetical protein
VGWLLIRHDGNALLYEVTFRMNDEEAAKRMWYDEMCEVVADT